MNKNNTRKVIRKAGFLKALEISRIVIGNFVHKI